MEGVRISKRLLRHRKILSGRRYPLLFPKNLHKGVSMRGLLDLIVSEMLRSSRVHTLWTIVKTQHRHHTIVTWRLPTFAVFADCKQRHDMVIFIPELNWWGRSFDIEESCNGYNPSLCEGMVTLMFKGTMITCSCYSCTLKLSNIIINCSW